MPYCCAVFRLSLRARAIAITVGFIACTAGSGCASISVRKRVDALGKKEAELQRSILSLRWQQEQLNQSIARARQDSDRAQQRAMAAERRASAAECRARQHMVSARYAATIAKHNQVVAEYSRCAAKNAKKNGETAALGCIAGLLLGGVAGAVTCGAAATLPPRAKKVCGEPPARPDEQAIWLALLRDAGLDRSGDCSMLSGTPRRRTRP